VSAAGCADKRGGAFAYSPSNFGTPDAPKVVALEANYRIAPLDTLSIKVFKMPDLSGDVEVDLTGRISIPLIGDVTATDFTTAQLDEELTRRLGAKYLENPDVSVSVKSSASRVVTVDGAVTKAGAIPVSGPVTLMQAVAQAGGVTAEANIRRVAVFRQIGGKRHAASFDLASIRQGEMEDPQIYPGDIIIIDGSSNKALQKRILGAIPLVNIFTPF
jgi:polysaccharide export outer membrane protein